MKYSISAKLLRLLLCVIMYSAVHGDVSISSSRLSLTFNNENEMISIRETFNGVNDGTTHNREPRLDINSLWEAQFLSKHHPGHTIDIKSTEVLCEDRNVTSISDSIIHLNWFGVHVTSDAPTINVVVEVSIDPMVALAEMFISFSSSSGHEIEEYGLWQWKINTPAFYRDARRARVVNNVGLGVLHSCVGATTDDCFPSFNNIYPQATFQFVSLYHIADDVDMVMTSSSITSATNIESSNRSSDKRGVGGNIYVAAHDTEAYIKWFSHDNLGETSTFAIAAQPKGAGKPFTSITSDFPFIIGLFETSPSTSSSAATDDGWYTAASIYRDFILQNSRWTSSEAGGGPLSHRADFPAWLSDITVWINSHWQGKDIFERVGGDPLEVLQRVSNIQDIFNLRFNTLAFHWYEWDLLGYNDTSYSHCASETVCGFDTHYPSYFPARDRFEGVVSTLQQEGVRVTPYINGRIYDVALEMWETDHAALHASKQNSKLQFNATVSELELYYEEYGNGAKQAVMCPTTSYWQDIIVDTVATLVNTYHVDGVYIDQIAAAGPAPCLDESHDHSIGGGEYWVKGYTDMLNSARSTIGNNTIILTESNVESYMNSVNVYLSLVGFDGVLMGEATIVPIFPTIYSGYMILAGAEFAESDLNTNPDIFCGKLAMMYVFGAQLGWFSLGNGSNKMGLYQYFMSGDYDDEIEYLRVLAAHKLMNKQWFVYGRKLRDIQMDIKDEVEGVPHQFPSILSSIWMDSIYSTAGVNNSILITMTCIIKNEALCGHVSLALDIKQYYTEETLLVSLQQSGRSSLDDYVFDLFYLDPYSDIDDSGDVSPIYRIFIKSFNYTDLIYWEGDIERRSVTSLELTPRLHSK